MVKEGQLVKVAKYLFENPDLVSEKDGVRFMQYLSVTQV